MRLGGGLSVNINEEKAYIYTMMKEITEERRRLTDIYYSLKKRLDTLYQLEQRGLENLSIKGYVDLCNEYNQRQNEIAISNIKRETKHIISELKNAKFNNSEDEKEEQNTEAIPKHEIEKEKDKEPKRKSYLNVDKVIDCIVSVLKEAGTPMATKALHQKVCEQLGRDIKSHNFRANIMPKAMQRNDKIQRVTRGYYQYKA